MNTNAITAMEAAMLDLVMADKYVVAGQMLVAKTATVQLVNRAQDVVSELSWLLSSDKAEPHEKHALEGLRDALAPFGSAT